MSTPRLLSVVIIASVGRVHFEVGNKKREVIKPFWRWEKEPVDPAVVGTKLINYTLPRVSIVSFQGQSAATVGSSIIGVFRPNDSLLNPPALDVSQLVDPLPRQRTSIFDVSMRSCGPHPTRGPAEALVCHPHHTHTHRWTASCVCVSGCHFYLIKSNRCLLDSRPLRTCFVCFVFLRFCACGRGSSGPFSIFFL